MKARQIVIERGPGASQPGGQPPDLDESALDRLARQTYLTVPEAAAYLRCSVNAFRCWALRRQLPRASRGRILLYLRRDLDEAVQPALRAANRRHRRAV